MASMSHPAACPIVAASQSNGADTSVAAPSPTASHTLEMTGISQTLIALLSKLVGSRSSHLLPDVPEEVDQRHGGTADDGGATGDEYAELAAGGEMGIGRVRPESPHDRRHDQC